MNDLNYTHEEIKNIEDGVRKKGLIPFLNQISHGKGFLYDPDADLYIVENKWEGDKVKLFLVKKSFKWQEISIPHELYERVKRVIKAERVVLSNEVVRYALDNFHILKHSAHEENLLFSRDVVFDFQDVTMHFEIPQMRKIMFFEPDQGSFGNFYVASQDCSFFRNHMRDFDPNEPLEEMLNQLKEDEKNPDAKLIAYYRYLIEATMPVVVALLAGSFKTKPYLLNKRIKASKSKFFKANSFPCDIRKKLVLSRRHSDILAEARKEIAERGMRSRQREHMRMGHWRHYKTGYKTWINSYVAGDKSLGTIKKDYTLQ